MSTKSEKNKKKDRHHDKEDSGFTAIPTAVIIKMQSCQLPCKDREKQNQNVCPKQLYSESLRVKIIEHRHDGQSGEQSDACTGQPSATDGPE